MNSVCSGKIKVFTCNSNISLAEKIAKTLNIDLAKSEVGTFSDGEIRLRINETVRGCDVYIIQSTSSPVNDNLMELLIMIDAVKRASAGRITAVIPYFGYARQDRKSRARDPISAKLVANLITTAGADRLLTMDLHCAQIQAFFDIPMDHLVGMPKFRQYYKEKFEDTSDLMVVSPDLGSVTRARSLGDKLNVPMAIIDKRRPEANKSEVMHIIGKVAGKRAILVDDLTDTAGSLVNAATAIINAGAKEVYACCTHGVLSGPAIERIAKSPIKELLLLDTIDIGGKDAAGKLKTISVSDVFSEAIRRIHLDLPVSEMFDD